LGPHKRFFYFIFARPDSGANRGWQRSIDRKRTPVCLGE
jgi:hypothetical protein